MRTALRSEVVTPSSAPLVRQESLGEEDERRTETSRTNLAADRSLPGKGGHTRNRVLRGDRATGAAKRTQGAQLPRDRASKAPIAGASAVRGRAGSTCAPYGLSAPVPPGSKSEAGCAREVRQEPGRSPVPCVSPVGHPVKCPGSTTPRSAPSRTNQRARRR